MHPQPEPATTTIHHPLAIRRLAVQTVERPTLRLVRVTLGGPQLDGFASLAPDDHVRVFLPTPGTTELVLPEIGEHGVAWPTSGPRPPATARRITSTQSRRRSNSTSFCTTPAWYPRGQPTPPLDNPSASAAHVHRMS